MHDGTGPQRPSVPGDGWVEVDLPFPGVRQFEDEFAPNLATDGLFIPMRDPLPPSTVVRFHVTLPDNFVLLEGTGIVVWAREPGDPSGAPPGMSLRFATLSQHYQDLLDRIVQTHVERGGTPFEVEPRVGHAQSAEGAEPPSPAARGVASERPRLTVRRTGVPDTSAPGELPEGDGGTSVPDLAGPFDRTISLPPAGVEAPSGDRGVTSDDEDSAASPSASDFVEMPSEEERATEAFWPPWEAEVPRDREDAVVADADLPGFESGEVDRRGIGDPSLDGLEIEGLPGRAEPSEDAARSGLPDELFSDDLDVDSSSPELVEHGDPTPVVPPAVTPVEAANPRRRWSMGRTVATLAAAIVVVGVVAVLVLSPWSRFVDSEVDEAPPVVVADEAATGLSAGDQLDDPTPVAPGTEPVDGVQSSAEPAVQVSTSGISGTASDVPPPPQPSDLPASRIESITWQEVDGTTRVTLRGDGRLVAGRVAVIPMASPPRVLIRIRFIETRYEAYVLDVGTTAVTAIRTGLHPELTPPALYVVCDLSDDGVRVLDSAFDADTMTVTFGR